MEVTPVAAGIRTGQARSGVQPAVDRVADYFANPDGPWPRPPQEIRAEVLQLAEWLRGVLARPLSTRQVAEDFGTGAYTAARWSLAMMDRRPMDGIVAPVCDAEINGQLTHALRQMRPEGPRWEFAFGVTCWLQWLTGQLDEIPYRELP